MRQNLKKGNSDKGSYKASKKPSMISAIEINGPFGEILGGSNQHLFEMANKGIDYPTFEKLVNNVPFSEKEITSYMHISEKTLKRRKDSKASFSSTESEKILQIQQIVAKGLEVFEDMGKVKKWLERENYALGGKKPKELLYNSFGVQLLIDELGRIEHGIFA
jgi:putative toxin-antitoxin system antitoxin component (TIGR02293 family)